MKLSDTIQEFSKWRHFKVSGKTVVRYEKVLKIFCLCMRNPDIESLHIEEILEYLVGLEKLGWKRNGITIVCLALRKLFEYCNLKGMKVLNETLIPIPRKEFKLPRIADEASFKKLTHAIPVDNKPHNIRNRALINLIWDTGARSGEILSIDVGDLDLENNHAVIKTEKSRGRRPIREIFWSEKTTTYIKKWMKKRDHLKSLFTFEDEEALFISISKCPQKNVRGSRMTVNGVCEVNRILSNRAGIPVLNAHSMRHYMGRSIIEQGGSNSDVTNILGHSNIESSFIYTMMTGNQLQKRYMLFRGTKQKYHLKKLHR